MLSLYLITVLSLHHKQLIKTSSYVVLTVTVGRSIVSITIITNKDGFNSLSYLLIQWQLSLVNIHEDSEHYQS